MSNSWVEETVKLVKFEPEHLPVLKEFSLPEEQRQFTGMPEEVLAACETDPTRHPVVILYEGVPAGFFVLHGNGAREYSDNPGAILLRGYSINNAFQGKGIASKSIRLLPSYVKRNFPEINEIVLGVNHANKVAQHVYKKGGFNDRGLRKMGKKGEQYILHLDL